MRRRVSHRLTPNDARWSVTDIMPPYVKLVRYWKSRVKSAYQPRFQYMNIRSFLRRKIMIHSPYGSMFAGSQSRQAADALRRKLALYPGPVARLPRCRQLSRCASIPKSYRKPPAFCPFRLENPVYCPKKHFLCPTLSVSGNKHTENKHSLGAAQCGLPDNFAGKYTNSTPPPPSRCYIHTVCIQRRIFRRFPGFWRRFRLDDCGLFPPLLTKSKGGKLPDGWLERWLSPSTGQAL